jgi:hypothetical protein
LYVNVVPGTSGNQGSSTALEKPFESIVREAPGLVDEGTLPEGAELGAGGRDTASGGPVGLDAPASTDAVTLVELQPAIISAAPTRARTARRMDIGRPLWRSPRTLPAGS